MPRPATFAPRVLLLDHHAVTPGPSRLTDDPRRGVIEEPLELPGALRTAARWWSAGRDDAPLVLMLPALGTPASAYDRLGAALALAGLHAGSVDLRGFGASSVRAGRERDWGYAELVRDELPALLARGRARHPRSRVLWLGHSLGGHLALLRAAAFPTDAVAGIVLVASGTPHWRAFSGRVALTAFVLGHLVPALTAILGWYPGRRVGFGGNQPRSLMRQWARCARRGVLVPGPAPAQSLHDALPALRLPVLPIAIEGDAFAPPAAIRALLAGLAPAPALRPVGAGPGEQPLDHFRWLRAPDGVAREVAAFARALADGSTHARA